MDDVRLRLRTEGAPEVVNDLNSISTAMQRGTVSTAQQANQMRMLGPQISQSISGLLTGQSPMMVLMQQGHQVVDIFGGSIPQALKGLGSFFTPVRIGLGLIGATIGAVVLAYKQGKDEGDAYNTSLAMTGNFAGVTQGKLAMMARDIRTTVGASGDAAAAIAQMAATGAVAGDQLARAGTIAVQFNRLGVQSIEKTVAAFAELGKDPVGASRKLDDQMHYLSASIYAQIKALADQGRQTEAVALAQSAFANGSQVQIDAISAKLGPFERKWMSLKDAILGAWQAMVPDTATTEQRLEAVGKKIAEVSARARGQHAREQLPSLQLESNDLLRRSEIETGNALFKGANDAQNAAGKRWVDSVDQFLSRAEQRKKAIELATGIAKEAGTPDADLAKRIAVINDMFDPGTRLEQIRGRADIAQEKIKQAIGVVVDQFKLGNISQEQYAQQVTDDDLKAIEVKRQQAKEELDYYSGKMNSERQVAALQAQIATLNQQYIGRQKQGEQEVSEIIALRDRAGAMAIAQRRQDIRNADNNAGNQATADNTLADQSLWSGIINGSEQRQIEKAARLRAQLTDKFNAGDFGDPQLAENRKAYEDAFKSIGAGLDTLDNRMQTFQDTFRNDFIQTGKLSGKAFSDMFMQEIRRALFDSLIKDSLKSVMGGFSGLLTTGMNALSGGLLGLLPGHADGLSYVPYDNYAARLHKGERVLTAAENRQAMQGPAVNVTQNFTVGDVATISMVRDAVRGSEARIKTALGRSQRFGGAMA